MHDSSNNGFWSESDHNEDRRSRSFGMLTGFGAGSERRWRTNELGDGGTEDRRSFCNKNRQRCSSQSRRERNRLGINYVSGGTNPARVVGCGRVLVLQVGRL